MKILMPILCLFLWACANTNYQAWEGGGVIKGQGGAKEVIDGMEVWVKGQPPRKYRVIGYIEDERGAGLIPRKALYGDLVETARTKGGDAVILLSKDSEVTGVSQTQGTYNSFTQTYNPGNTMVHKKLSTKAHVIEYVR